MDKNDDITGLIRRAALLRLLAAGFLYPDAALKQRLLKDIAAMPAGDAAAPALAALERAWSMADEESLTDEYSRLFIGGDAVVLHETTYSGTGRSTELADINGFYLAFGFDLRAGQHEVADHLGVELEFYSLLLLKQAYALEQGWQDKFEITRDAAKAFLADHLGRWVDSVRERAAARQAAPATAMDGGSAGNAGSSFRPTAMDGGSAGNAGSSFRLYQALFEAAAAAVQRECQTLAVQPAPLMCSGPDFMQNAAFVCPMEQASAEPPLAPVRPPAN